MIDKIIKKADPIFSNLMDELHEAFPPEEDPQEYIRVCMAFSAALLHSTMKCMINPKDHEKFLEDICNYLKKSY